MLYIRKDDTFENTTNFAVILASQTLFLQSGCKYIKKLSICKVIPPLFFIIVSIAQCSATIGGTATSLTEEYRFKSRLPPGRHRQAPTNTQLLADFFNHPPGFLPDFLCRVARSENFTFTTFVSLSLFLLGQSEQQCSKKKGKQGQK